MHRLAGLSAAEASLYGRSQDLMSGRDFGTANYHSAIAGSMSHLQHMGMSGHTPGAFLRYMRQSACLKQEHTCQWVDPDIASNPKRAICGKLFYSMHEMVTHITVDHVGVQLVHRI
jgi:hypothetical protein